MYFRLHNGWEMSSGYLHHYAVLVLRKVSMGRDLPIIRRRLVLSVVCSTQERPITIFDVLRIN